VGRPLSEEYRLVKTLITGKPHPYSLAVTLGMVALIALVTQIYWMNLWDLAEWMPAVHEKVFSEGEWWRVVTATFIHADIAHYLSNMYTLGLFGFFIFGYFGFYVFPILSLASATLVNVISIATYSPEVRLLGASGLVYVLGGFWLTMYFLIQRQYRLASRLLRVFGIGLMIFFPTTFTPTTSYRTHAIGFVIGVGIALFYFSLKKKQIRSYEVYKVIDTDLGLNS
jgi:rhomboid protease GluP